MLGSLWFIGNAEGVQSPHDVIQKIEKIMNNIHTKTQKRTTYRSSKLTLPLTSHLGQNVGLGEG